MDGQVAYTHPQAAGGRRWALALLAAAAVAVAACGGTDDAGDSPAVTPDAPTPGAPESPGESPAAPPEETPAESPAAGMTEVIVDDIAFGQDEITVSPGTTVTWTNADAVGHTVTHGENGTPVASPLFNEALPVGGTVQYTFDETGTYPVTCTIHPSMQMEVTVE